ncbi:TPA: transposase [Salmonella enterica]|nr:transposase [Salmonella enterica]EIM5533446.1 transposase [Salmonella enterica subsp. enterica]
MESQSWRKEPRKIYSNDFKLRIVELASRPDACIAQIARENGINDNVIFKWLRLWQKEGRVSRRLPATINTSTSPTLLPVEVISDTTPSGELKTEPELLPVLNAASCCVEFRYGKMTLEKPSSELLAVLLRELTGRTGK